MSSSPVTCCDQCIDDVSGDSFSSTALRANPLSQRDTHNQALASNNQVKFKCNLIVRDIQTSNNSLRHVSPSGASVRLSLEGVGRWLLGCRRVGSLEAAGARVFGVHVTGRSVTDPVSVGASQRQVGRILVRRRLEASHAEAGHG